MCSIKLQLLTYPLYIRQPSNSIKYRILERMFVEIDRIALYILYLMNFHEKVYC